MAKFNKTEDHTFARVCDTFVNFEIPNFQRPYAWTNKNLQDFWSSIVQNEEQYFIGNIIAVDDKPLKIIDGQQRLTTISLLLCAIRDVYTELKLVKDYDKQLVAQREVEINKYLIWTDLGVVPQVDKKRLKLGKDIYQSIFDKIIDKDSQSIALSNIGDNEKRFFNNYKILKSLVKKYIEGSEISRLDEIKNKVLNLQVIVIVCDTDNDIYGIFEGFNSTGLGLSVADLVKNALLKASAEDNEAQKLIENQWGELEELFEETSASKFPKFLRHQWISENGPVVMANLYNKIKIEKIANCNIVKIKRYTEAVLNDAKIYVAMIYHKKTNLLDLDNSIKDLIIEFRYLRNDQVYEVLLSWYKLYKNKKIKKQFFEKSLSRLWKFVVRAKFVSINPSDYEKIFSNHCLCVYDNKNTKTEIELFFEKLKPLVAQKQQFIDNFISDIKYGRDNKLIFRSFKDLMCYDNPEIAQSKPTIEHVLPQTPNKWKLSKPEIKDHVNKIGNLTVLFDDYNRENSNKKMKDKKNIFFKSSFLINQKIASDWSNKFEKDFKKAIIDRSVELVDRIEKLWQF